jgi:hypothetical protein
MQVTPSSSYGVQRTHTATAHQTCLVSQPRVLAATIDIQQLL